MILKKLFRLAEIYVLFVILFIVQKLVFMAYYHEIYGAFGFIDWLSVLFYGIRLDLSMAGYLTIIPAILLIFSVWFKSIKLEYILRGYGIVISLLISIIFVADLVLFKYWGFRLDSTPLFYLSTPKDALASGSWIEITGGFLVIVLLAALVFIGFKKRFADKINHTPQAGTKEKTVASGILVLAIGALFVLIRGGFTVSTMNVGQVFFSKSNELNLAAINPMFNLFESLTMEHDFTKKYHFMDDEKAKNIFATLTDKPVTKPQPALFTTPRPNVVLVVMESFMSKIIEPLGGMPGIAVNLNQLCDEGVLFTNFYANSFRTDRGLVSIISGYPAQPTHSIMKYTAKTQSLPSIPRTLGKAGYDLQYYYGGDADFTNMRSYLVSMGIEKIVCDRDFPVKQKIMTKWGAPDEFVFDRAANDIEKQQKFPFMKIIQTLSSHEPFEVPYKKLKDPYLNSAAYTDSCIGHFISRMKKTPQWKNTIFIFVPDHCMRYPENIGFFTVERFKIPLLMVGGAVKQPVKADVYGCQSDIAATLLSQMGLKHDDFTFSKNMLNLDTPHFGFFDFPDGFGMVNTDNQFIFDHQGKKTVLNTGKKDANKLKAEAYLQMLYEDMSKR